MDIALVGIGMDTSQVKAGEQVVVRSFANIGDAATRMNQYLTETERLQRRAAEASKLRAEIEQRAASGEKVRAGLFVEARRLEKEAIEQLAAAREAAWAKGGVLARAEGAAYAENAARAKLATAAKSEAARASTRLTGALSVLSTAAIGLPGPIGRVTSSLGALAIGSATTVGVLAGVAAISYAYNKLTEDARKAREETEKVIAAQARQARERTGEQLANDLKVAITEVDRLTVAYENAGRARQVALVGSPTLVGGANTTVEVAPDLKRQAEIARDLQEAQLARGNLIFQLSSRQRDAELDRLRAVRARQAEEKRAADEARQRFEDRQRQLADLAKTEAAAVLARAKLAKDAASEEAAIQAAARLELEQRIRGMDKLTEAEKERLRVAGLLVIEAEADARAQRIAAEAERERSRAVEERARQLATLRQAEAGLGVVGARASGDPAAVAEAERQASIAAIDEQVRKMDQLNWLERERLRLALLLTDELERQNKATRDAEREAQQRYKAALRTTTDAFQKAFVGIWQEGFDGFESFFDAIEKLAAEAAASIAAAMAIEALGIDKLLKNLTGPEGGKYHQIGKGFTGPGSFAGNVLGGFAAGQIGGNLAGNGVGGAFAGAAGGFAIGGPVGAIVGGVTGLISGLTSAGERARELERFRKEFEANLDAFVLAASGGATDLAVSIQQVQRNAERLRDEALEATFKKPGITGIDDLEEYQATLDEITRAEQEYIANLEREAELKRQQIGEDLEVRALRAQGRDEEADAAALAFAQARERLELEQLLKDQTDKSLLTQLDYVHALEAEALAKAKAEEAARKEAERLERQTRLTEDLQVRLLRAQGEGDAADTLARRIAFEREYSAALRDGMDAATLALIEQVYAQEELAIATAKAADEAQRLIDAIEREARAVETLTVRHLRATGATYAADEAAQLFAQQEERRRAIEEGRSQEFLAYLDQVQAEERAAADQARQAAQQSAFDAAVRSAFPADATFLPDSRTSVNLAVGVSESTASQMAGLMRSQLSYQANLVHLPEMKSALVRIDATLAAVLARGGLATVVDEGLGILGADADAANGVPPGNT